MSVINRMLSELDARQQPLPTEWAFAAITPPALPRLRSHRRAWAMSLTGATLIAVTSWTDWTALLPEPTVDTPTAQAPADEPPLLALSPAVLPQPSTPTVPATPRGVHPLLLRDTVQAAPAAPAASTPGAAASAPRTLPGPRGLALHAPVPANATVTALTASAAAHSFAAAAADLLQRAPTSAGPLLASVKPSLSAPATALSPSTAATPSAVTAPTASPTVNATVATAAPVTTAATLGTGTGTGAIEKQMVALTGAQRAALAYRQAVELAASGHSTQAIDRAQEALKADADHIPARQLAAALMFEKQRLSEATALLREGLERRPGQPQLTYLLARLKAETGDSAAALALLAQTSELGADGHGLKAVLLSRQGQFAAAANAYEAALRLSEDNAGWWVGLGVALEANGQVQQARLAYQRARTAGPLNADLQAFVERKLSSAAW